MKKAQGLTEFLLIAALISITALTVMSPFGGKVKDFFISFSPTKNEIAFNAKSLSKNIESLKNSDNPDVQQAGNTAESLASTLNLIKSNHQDQISNDALVTLLNNLKIDKSQTSTGSETSGTVGIVAMNNIPPQYALIINALNNTLSQTTITFDVNTNLTKKQQEAVAAMTNVPEGGFKNTGTTKATVNKDLNSGTTLDNLVNTFEISDKMLDNQNALDQQGKKAVDNVQTKTDTLADVVIGTLYYTEQGNSSGQE